MKGRKTHKNTHWAARRQDHTITVPVILGPTAAGKTAIALQIAESAGYEIISCDSRQIYRGMDIGTAKPSAAELRRVRHLLIDILEPSECYSAYRFAEDASGILRNGIAREKLFLVCGGSGLYFETLRNGIGPRIETDPSFREALLQRAKMEGSVPLHRELHEKDPESAASIHENDLQRIVRALAVLAATGRKFSTLKGEKAPPSDLSFRAVVFAPPREALYQRIGRRVDAMIRNGLWEEFSVLLDRRFNESSPGLACVGYRELFAVRKGTCSLAEATEAIKRNTRRFAKRQMTWFRAHNPDEFVDYIEDETILLERVKKILAIQ